MASPPAHLEPRVLRWARESFGLSVEEAAVRVNTTQERLEGAERGERNLTMRQVERAARVYERPLAALFAPEPPEEEPQEAQFRRLPGAPEPPWPSEMIGLSRRVRERQEAAADLLDLLDEEPVWPEVNETLNAPPEAAAEMIRGRLGISLAEQASWRDRSGYAPLRHWVDAVEDLGVLVMHDGSLPVEVMRGFASLHPIVPAIVVNTQDDPRARVYTLIHELGHLYQAERFDVANLEPWLEQFAGDVLMPLDALAEEVERIAIADGLRRFDEIALRFGVTPRAAVVRAAQEELIAQEEADEILGRISARGPRQRGGGGDYYWTKISRLSPAYTRLVFSALETQAVTYAAASSLLGVKVGNFERMRGYLDRRAEMG
ncbi:MAG TPA: XRE family transcriptional regulator [Solirubrobacterales bacterium]|nr:XRE family transcriptional regulator [Solirubrobacterales bacterium]